MDLLRRVERYLKRSATTPTRFGRDAIGDPCFVKDLRRGREPRPQTAARVTAFLEQAEASVGNRRCGR